MALPSIPGVTGQLINSLAYDYSSIEITIGAQSHTNISEISYANSLEPGHLRAASAKKLARTRGDYNCEGSFTIYKADTRVILGELSALGKGGYGEASFDIQVVYLEGSELTTDALLGCRITNIEDSHSTGSDALMSAITLDIMEITLNGLSMTSGGASGAGVGAALGGLLGGGL